MQEVGELIQKIYVSSSGLDVQWSPHAVVCCSNLLGVEGLNNYSSLVVSMTASFATPHASNSERKVG